MENIYILRLGDNWLSKTSISVIGYYTSKKQALEALEQELKESKCELYCDISNQGTYGVWHNDNGNKYFEEFGCYDIETTKLNERY